ncbi:MAG: hypothetical protein V1895_03760 [Parcubacteria group bacterium]
MTVALKAERGGHHLPVLLIVVIWLATFVILLAKTVPVSGDGIYYFVQLESLVQDHDLDYANNLEQFRTNPHVAKQLDSGVTTPTGRTPNLFSIGPALFWAPFYLVAQGRTIQLLAPSVATSLYVLLGLFLVYATCRRCGLSRWPCAVALVAAYLGTNLWYYSTFEASMAHGLGFSLVSLLVYLTVRFKENRTLLWHWLLLGLVAGLATCVRWQLLLVALVVPGLELARQIWRGKSLGPGLPKLLRPLLFCLGLLLGVLPQLLVWHRLYGVWLLVPQGDGFIDLTSPHFGEVLISARHGLLTWTPLVVLGIVGLIVAVRAVDRRLRYLGLACVLILVLQTYLNGTLLEWWGGEALGARRFTDILVVVAVGLAALFSQYWRGRWVRVVLIAVSAILVAANLTLTQLYRHDRISRVDAVHLPDLVEALGQ